MLKQKRINLHLFDEGATGETTGAQSENGAETEVQAEAQQVADAGTETFEELVKGKYKSDAQKYFDRVFKKRFAELKGKWESDLRESEEKYQALIESQLDGADEEETEGKAETLSEKEQSVLEELEKISEQSIKIKRMEDHKALMNQLEKSAEEFKAMLPNFDLDAALQDKTFSKAVWATGGNILAAYTAVHPEIIMAGLAQNAFQKGREKTQNAILRQTARPLENGIRSQATMVIKPDVHKFTPQQRQAFLERARRGERITFD